MREPWPRRLNTEPRNAFKSKGGGKKSTETPWFTGVYYTMIKMTRSCQSLMLNRKQRNVSSCFSFGLEWMWKSCQDHRGSICGLNIVNYELTQDAFPGKARTINSRSVFSPKHEKTGGKEGKMVKDTSWKPLLKKKPNKTSAFLPLGIPSKTPVKYDVWNKKVVVSHEVKQKPGEKLETKA